MSAGGDVLSIAILAPPGAQSLDVSGPLDVFREAARLSKAGPSYEVSLVGVRRDRVIEGSGMLLLADYSIWDAETPIDTLIVAGTPDFEAVSHDAALVEWLRRRAATARRYGSVCTGTFLLGAAGLLDGRRATTHRRHADELEAACPSAIVEPDRVYIRDGDLYTSAGPAAGLNLALALVEEDHGHELALAVASNLVVPGKRAIDQRQISPYLAAQSTTQPTIRELQTWILDHLAEDLSLEQLASKAGYGVRNLSRVFHRETGMTAAQFVAAARVESAQRMLEDTALPLKRVAAFCGFSGTAHLRRALVAELGYGPHEYRERLASSRNDVAARRGGALAPMELANPSSRPLGLAPD